MILHCTNGGLNSPPQARKFWGLALLYLNDFVFSAPPKTSRKSSKLTKSLKKIRIFLKKSGSLKKNPEP